ncbi:MAG: glycosyltransferase family 39 protein [Anaerolineae bacterium]|nr:glycosyltransferase family 39 protein [Anaerolineae bacterium]
MQSTTARPRYFWAAAVLILLAGFGLRTWQLGSASLWLDEAVTDFWLNSPSDSFYSLILESGTELPLYFTLMRPLDIGTEALIRFPSVLFGVIGIALLMFVVLRLYDDPMLCLLAGALLAFNPYHIWLSRTARPYTLAFVGSLLASYFFLALLRGERSRANWIGFVLSSIAAYLTHYFAASLPLAQYILFAFILRGNRGFFRRWQVAQCVAVIPVFIWLIELIRQPAVSLGVGWIPRPGLHDIPLTLWNMTLGYDGSLAWYIVPGLAAAGIGLLTGLYYAVRERKANRINFYWFWLVVGPLLGAFVVSQVRPVYVDRYFMISLPAVILLTVEGWQHLPRNTWRVVLAGAVITGGAASTLITIHQGDDVKEDWRAAAAYVEQAQQSDDGCLTKSPLTLLSFLRYFDGDTECLWLAEGPAVAGEYEKPVRRVWAIMRNPNEDGHRQGVLADFDPLEQDSLMTGWLLARRDRIVSQREFNGLAVLLVDTGDEFAGADD